MNAWIYCSERRPPTPAIDDAYTAPYVLVTTTDGDVRRGRPWYFYDDNTFSLTFAGWRTDGEGWDIEVKAWMPLPEPAP